MGGRTEASGQHTQNVGKEGLYSLSSPGVPGWRRGSSRVSLKTSSRTGAYACTKPSSVSPLLPHLKMAFSESSRPAWQDEAVPTLPIPEMCDSLGKSDIGNAACAKARLNWDVPGRCPVGIFPFSSFRYEPCPLRRGKPGRCRLSPAARGGCPRTGSERLADPAAAALGGLDTLTTSRPGPSAPLQSRAPTEAVLKEKPRRGKPRKRSG